MKYEHIVESISDRRNRDHVASECDRSIALIEYVAMMGDIDLPETEESEGAENVR